MNSLLGTLSGYANIIIAVATVVSAGAAIATFFIARLVYKFTTNQAKSSVKPLIMATITYPFIHDGRYETSFVIYNNGIGPAIIKKFSLFYNGNLIEINKDFESMLGAIKEILDIDIRIADFSIFEVDESIRSGSSKTLLKITTPINYRISVDSLRSVINNFDVKFTYEDIYETKFAYSSASS